MMMKRAFLLLLLAAPAWATSSINPYVPRSNCSGDTPPSFTYCVSDSDCPGGQTCVHQSVLSADVRQNFAAAYNEINDLQTNKMYTASGVADNAITRFDGTGGAFVQSSRCSISDVGALSCGVTSGSSPGLSVTYSGSGDIAQAVNSQSNGMYVANDGSPIFSYTGAGATLTQKNAANSILTLLDPTLDSVVFGNDASLSTSSGLAISGKNYQVDGDGTYGMSFDRTFTPDSNGDDAGDWYTAIKSDVVSFDLKNADASGGSFTSATFRHVGLNSKIQATGTTKRFNQNGRYLMIDSVQDIDATILSSSGQIHNIMNEQRFGGAFSNSNTNPMTHMVMHPLGMTTSGAGRTSGSVTLTGVGYYGNDTDGAGSLRVLSTDYINGFFMAPVELPSASGLPSDWQVAPIYVACKTGSDSPTCKGRSFHMPAMTIGAVNTNYSNPLTSLQSMSAVNSDGADAIFNVYAVNNNTAITSSVIGTHIVENRLSATGSITKTALRIDAGNAWNGSGSSVIGSDIFVSGGTTNIAERYATTGNAALTTVPKTTTLTCSSGTTCTWASAIPDGATVRSVTARVNTTVTGCTTMNIGDGSTANLWGGSIAVAAGTTTTSADYTAATAVGLRTSTTNITLTCVGGGGSFTGGVVRLTVVYDADTAAIS